MLYTAALPCKMLKPSFHIVSMGRFKLPGLFQICSDKPRRPGRLSRRPQTTEATKKIQVAWQNPVLSGGPKATQRRSEKTKTTVWKLLDTTKNNPKQVHNPFHLLACSLRSFPLLFVFYWPNLFSGLMAQWYLLKSVMFFSQCQKFKK